MNLEELLEKSKDEINNKVISGEITLKLNYIQIKNNDWDKKIHYEFLKIGRENNKQISIEIHVEKKGFENLLDEFKKFKKNLKDNPVFNDYSFEINNIWMKIGFRLRIIPKNTHIQTLDELIKIMKELIEKTKKRINDKINYKPTGSYISMNTVFNKNTNNQKNTPLNQILYGPPGTGKTYNTINKSIEIINPSFDLTQDRTSIKKEFDRLVEEGRIVFTTFHQSMSYEDFIEGIKPQAKSENNSSISYVIEPGIFKKICTIANDSKFYKNILKTDTIIGEYKLIKSNEDIILLERTKDLRIRYIPTLLINDLLEALDGNKISLEEISDRKKKEDSSIEEKKLDTNISTKINTKVEKFYFGLASTLRDICKLIQEKRETPTEEKGNFVLIIDEINRGNVSQIFGELITLIEEDKRIGNTEALEVTLPYSKEKFGVPSNLYIIGTMNTADRSVEALDTALRRRFTFEEMPPKYDLPELEREIEGVKLLKILETINKRIEKLLDKDHLIGHSFFINVQTPEELRNTFYKNIIPLLQEYFFGDYGKIGLILGSGFVSKKENNNVFSNFEYDETESLNEKVIYEIIDYRNDASIDKFKDAIKNLVK